VGSAKWSSEDAQRFKDRDVLKASSVPSKRPTGPSQEDWDMVEEILAKHAPMTEGFLVCDNEGCGYEVFCHMEQWGFPGLVGGCPQCEKRSIGWVPSP
jgi:hypothetical protein